MQGERFMSLSNQQKDIAEIKDRAENTGEVIFLRGRFAITTKSSFNTDGCN